MAEFTIEDQDLTGLKDKVIIVTGSSSGIGLGTVKVLLKLGASVIGADIEPPREPIDSKAFTHHATNVASWADLVALFKKTKETYGRIDHVFANAGIGPVANYFRSSDNADDHDADGNPLEPDHKVYDINLKGVVNAASLAVYYMQQQASGGSIVITCSIASIQRFRGVDYCATKHAVFGFMRAMRQQLVHRKLPIRINGLAPSWTRTAMPPDTMHKLGIQSQAPEDVGRAAALLMTDSSRHGQLLFVARGKCKEVDEAILTPAYHGIIGEGNSTEDEDFQNMIDAIQVGVANGSHA